jgi:predicted  nucleic acid-binding Zn-ribbon protein
MINKNLIVALLFSSVSFASDGSDGGSGDGLNKPILQHSSQQQVNSYLAEDLNNNLRQKEEIFKKEILKIEKEFYKSITDWLPNNWCLPNSFWINNLKNEIERSKNNLIKELSLDETKKSLEAQYLLLNKFIDSTNTFGVKWWVFNVLNAKYVKMFISFLKDKKLSDLINKGIQLDNLKTKNSLGDLSFIDDQNYVIVKKNTLSDETNNLKNDNEKLNKLLSSKEDEIVGLKKDNEDFVNQLKQKKHQIDQKEKDFLDLQNDFKIKLGENQNLNSQLQSLRNDINQSNSKVKEISEELVSNKTKIYELENNLANLNKQKEDLSISSQNTIRKLEKEVSDLNNKVDDLNGIKVSQGQDLNRLKSENERLTLKIDQQYKQMNAGVDQINKVIENNEKVALDAYKKKIEKYEEMIEGGKKVFEKEISLLKETIASKDKKIDQLYSDISSSKINTISKQDYNDLEDKYKNALNENDSLLKKITFYEQQEIDSTENSKIEDKESLSAIYRAMKKCGYQKERPKDVLSALKELQSYFETEDEK